MQPLSFLNRYHIRVFMDISVALIYSGSSSSDSPTMIRRRTECWGRLFSMIFGGFPFESTIKRAPESSPRSPQSPSQFLLSDMVQLHEQARLSDWWSMEE